MSTFLTVKQVAKLAQRHPVTVYLALQDGTLHGAQSKPKASWRVREECAEAWVEGAVCVHKQNVTQLRGRRSA